MNLDIRKNYSLKTLNTFGVDAKADFFLQINSLKELQKFVKNHSPRFNKILALGGGSNVLFINDFNGLILKLNLKGKQLVEEHEDSIIIESQAGENWHEFVEFCIENNWGGLENLSLIPGNVGTAPMQNIGAYGVELKDVFHKLKAIDKETGDLVEFDKEECQFAYRESAFKRDLRDKFYIVSVQFRLTKTKHNLNTSYGAIQQKLEERNISEPTIQDISEAVITIRRSKLPDPKQIGNAGSFFKNPVIDLVSFEKLKVEHPNIPNYPAPNDKVKIAAGWLIEKSGWKGKRMGNCGVHEKQALVIVNHGGATGQEIYDLSSDIQKSVFKNFGIKLEREVNVII